MSNDNNYFNTTNLQDKELETALENALVLKDKILALFRDKSNKDSELTPFDVQRQLYRKGEKFPLTSIRARMTTLTSDEKLIRSLKADAIGDYNAKNHTWRLSLKGQITNQTTN